MQCDSQKQVHQRVNQVTNIGASEKKMTYLVLICSFKEVVDTDDVAKDDDDDVVKASDIEALSRRIPTTFFMLMTE